MNLETMLAERISSGLKRKTITSCSKWAESYRMMGQPFPGPWNFDHHPWLKEIHDAKEEFVVNQKGAQLGLTETALNKTFYEIDVIAQSVLYLLPASSPDATDFSTSRFDPALDMSPHLANMFSDVKNIGHKRAGNANLYIRGSRSRSQLKSIPVALAILDEVDEMNQDNVPLTFERMSGQLEKQAFLLSTPTIDKFGINAYFLQSSQDYYMFKCPRCSRWTHLIFPDCLVITADDFTNKDIMESHLICKECNGYLRHNDKKDFLSLDNSKWVSTYTDRAMRGFHINQLYSMTVKPYELAVSYLKAQVNPVDEQEFYNSKLGLTHVVEGARVLDEDINNCLSSHKKATNAPPGSLVTIGIDVGKWLHYEVDQWFFDSSTSVNDLNLLATCKVLQEGKVLNFEELDGIIKQYRAAFTVVDAHPEKRKALELAQRFYGHVRLCIYGMGISSKQIHLHDEDEHTMTVDRTSWMDMSLGRFRRQKIVLPIDLSVEYKNHVKAPVRIYKYDQNGNPYGKYECGNEEDHFAHARTYSEIALQLAASLAQGQDISGVL